MINKLFDGKLFSWLLAVVGLFAPAGCRHTASREPAMKTMVPTLIWSWWKPDAVYVKSSIQLKNGKPTGKQTGEIFSQNWQGARPVSFISPSSAVLILSTGPVVVGSAKGNPMWQFDPWAQFGEAIQGLLGRHLARVEPFEKNEAIIQPRSLPLPNQWLGGVTLDDQLLAQLPSLNFKHMLQERHHATFGDGVLSPNGHFLAFTLQTAAVKASPILAVWNAATATKINLPCDPNIPIGAMVFSPRGDHLAVTYNPIPAAGPVCIIWSADTGTAVLKLSRQETWPGYAPSGIIYLPNHHLAITGDGKLLLANLVGKGHLHLIPKHKLIRFTGALLALPDNRQFVAAIQSTGGTNDIQSGLAICNDSTGRVLRRIHFHLTCADFWSVSKLALSNHPLDAIAALTSHLGGGLGFFCEIDLTTGKMVWRSPDIVGGCTSLAVSPDGRAAITGGPLGAILWRLPVGKMR